jgi:hypothetical protein
MSVFGIVAPLVTVDVPAIGDADVVVATVVATVGAVVGDATESVAVGAPGVCDGAMGAVGIAVGDALPLLHAARAAEAAAAVMSVKNRLRVSIAVSDCMICSSLLWQSRAIGASSLATLPRHCGAAITDF